MLFNVDVWIMLFLSFFSFFFWMPVLFLCYFVEKWKIMMVFILFYVDIWVLVLILMSYCGYMDDAVDAGINFDVVMGMWILTLFLILFIEWTLDIVYCYCLRGYSMWICRYTLQHSTWYLRHIAKPRGINV